MRKVVEGVVYDTEKAEALHDWSNHYPCNDFKACSETLYRTKKGRFFLHGEGGAMTSYRSAYGNMFGSGADILPMSPQDALNWLASHDGTDVILGQFADQVEEA